MSLFFIAVFLVIAIPTAYAGFIGAPLAVTDKQSLRKIIEAIELKDGDTFYELGTGTGRVISAFARSKNITALGFELSPLFYLITRVRLKISAPHTSRVEFKNLFKASFGDADVIFFFLMPKTIEKLKNKLSAELKSGSKIISYAFPIKDWKIWKEIKEKDKPVVYLYKVD